VAVLIQLTETETD